MTISAQIIKDSLAPSGVRLSTFVLKYPRFIHAEVMTHRMFSRNASSSRAIPFKKQMAAIKDEMAAPLEFRANQKGMQAGERLSWWRSRACSAVWRLAGHVAIGFAKALDWLGAHKQYVNRLVEPFAHITVVLTGTDEAMANWFALRNHPKAQPEIQALARAMLKEYRASAPNALFAGEWHLPFVEDLDFPDGDTSGVDWQPLIERSVACCARTSYNNHDGTAPNGEKDAKLHDDLLNDTPMHASPSEHQARAESDPEIRSGNLHGWTQYRKMLAGEYITELGRVDDV